MEEKTFSELFTTLVDKTSLKLAVYDKTLQAFQLFKQQIHEINEAFHQQYEASQQEQKVRFDTRERGDFEIELTFGSDVLLFLMHTNVFEFSRDHQLMRSAYIRQDKQRSFCGVIHIYNFLADSFRYKRKNDLGYLIGRVFVNKENHFFTEGKRELGFLQNEFNENTLDSTAVKNIILSAVGYTINFDLLTPPFDAIKLISVGEMMNTLDAIPVTTAKRLGFRFQQDEPAE